MIALARYVLARCLVSQRWVPPIVLFALTVGVFYSAGGDAIGSGSIAALILFPATTWVTISALHVDDISQITIVAVSHGSMVRARIATLLTSFGCACFLAVLSVGSAIATDPAHQAYRISTGDVDTSRSVPLRDGLAAHVGDTVVTRRNESDLRIQGGRDRVKNGDLWTVTGIHRDGALDVAHAEHGAVIQLPAGYVAQHVEVGYARTISRSQGLTTEHAHVLGDVTMSREDAYTALSRGKESNRLYLAPSMTPRPSPTRSSRSPSAPAGSSPHTSRSEPSRTASRTW